MIYTHYTLYMFCIIYIWKFVKIIIQTIEIRKWWDRKRHDTVSLNSGKPELEIE